MTSLILAGATFVLAHLLLSSTPVRKKLVGRLGAGGFQGLYSLMVLSAFVWLISAYRSAPYVSLWMPPFWTRWIAWMLMPFAFVFMVAGFSTKNPTAAGQDAALDGGPLGIVNVTRHPGLWGFLLWGISHLATNGEAAPIVLAASLSTLALAGMLHIDARRRQSAPDAWQRFASRTSLVPFLALAQGRTKTSLREIGLLKIAIAAALFVATVFSHQWLIGQSPWAW